MANEETDTPETTPENETTVLTEDSNVDGNPTPAETLTADKGSEDGKSDKAEGSEDEKSEDGKTDKDEDGNAPETYEAFKLPEGLEADEKAVEAASVVFKELDLTQDQAQKLVDLQATAVADAGKAQMDAWEATNAEWVKAAKDDKEIGGTEFDANMVVAREGVTKFGTEEFKEMLNVTGVGNHPEMIRFLHRVGKAVSDDKVFHGSAPSKAADAAKTLFPDMN